MELVAKSQSNFAIRRRARNSVSRKIAKAISRSASGRAIALAAKSLKQFRDPPPSRDSVSRKIAEQFCCLPLGARGIAAESPQDLHRQIRGLGAESPVFFVCLRTKKTRPNSDFIGFASGKKDGFCVLLLV
jgi:hypothetical protein